MVRPGAIHRSDKNQQRIADELRQAGASVTILSSVGDGCPDIVAGWHGRNYLFEIKNTDGRLTKAEREWHEAWRGQCDVIWSAEDAFKVFNED